MMYMIIICISLYVFMIALINDSVITTSLTLIPFLAVLLIPNSLFIKIIRKRMSNQK